MRKFFILIFLSHILVFPGNAWGSSATAVTETEVEAGDGQTQVYQSVETTVDGQTVKKESTKPGRLELEMRKTGEGGPTVSFSQEEQTSSFSQPENSLEKIWQDLTNPVAEFVKKLLNILMLRFTQHQP